MRCALDGDATLFVGAGLSFLAKNKAGNTLPDGASLVDILLSQPLGTGSSHPLERIAGHIFRQKGADYLYDLLSSTLRVDTIDARLTKLYDLPWRRIYTTNYDDAIETAIKGRRPVSSLTLDDETSAAGPGSIIHLNGAINNVSPSTIRNGITLSNYSYSTSKLVESDWYKFFTRDLRSSRAIIFIGYSLGDLDIQRAVISDETFSRKTFFFISPKADELEIDAIQDYGQLTPGGIDALASAISSVAKDYESVRFSSAFVALTELHHATGNDARPTTNAQKLVDQLVYGRLPEIDVLSSEKVFGDLTYLVHRRQDR